MMNALFVWCAFYLDIVSFIFMVCLLFLRLQALFVWCGFYFDIVSFNYMVCLLFLHRKIYIYGVPFIFIYFFVYDVRFYCMSIP